MGRDALLLFAVILAGCAGSPSGSASDRIEGLITSTDGPMPQVRVSVYATGDDGRNWNGSDTSNASGRFVIDALTSPDDYSSSLLMRGTSYELRAEVEGYYVVTQVIPFDKRLHQVEIELERKSLDEIDSGGGAQQQDGPLMGNGGASPKR